MGGILYYVDPGTGFVFTQGASFLWVFFMGIFAGALFVLRHFFGFFRKFILLFLVLAVIVIIGGLFMRNSAGVKKVIVLGIDAMDPEITERMLKEGRLPNFAALRDKGGFCRLKTTVPSESVVAWTSFATGLNPGKHGILDFIMRDPKTYMPYLSLNDITSSKGDVTVSMRKKGDSFWDVFSRSGITSYIYFCPNTFPVERIRGTMLSGMGTPDITGTMGRFSFYTTRQLSFEDRESRGKIINVTVNKNNVHTKVYGPKVSVRGSLEDASLPLKIMLVPDKDKVFVSLQGQKFWLEKGQWSRWQRVSFKIGFSRSARGILRFYLRSVTPELELYVSPVNFDPQRPIFDVSFPRDYSAKLAKEIGLYYTQGMPYDTWALSEDRLDEKAFLEHADKVFSERSRILSVELKKFKKGVFFFYFDTLDMIQHMFWRYIDKKSPMFKDDVYRDTIYGYYEKFDRMLADVMKAVDDNTLLVVLSDHGFGPFRRVVHLNRWLIDQGYLCLKKGALEGREFLEDVDWSRSKAYALGFGGIYINKYGRENEGTVGDKEADEIKRAIASSLSVLTDPVSSENVVSKVYDGAEIFNGPFKDSYPDLYVGFNKGFRASWQTVLGAAPEEVIEDNKKKWSGDHLVDPALVPGVLFCNRRITSESPAIIDIAPTVLSWLGIRKNAMDGSPFFKESE